MITSSGEYTTEETTAHGELLGARYGEQPNVVWVFGGNTKAARVALEEIYSQPAIANYDFNFHMGSPFLADVAADPHIQDATKRCQVEKITGR